MLVISNVVIVDVFIYLDEWDKTNGGYPTTDGFNSMESHIRENKVSILHKDCNPYVKNFGNGGRFIVIYAFRITGGEQCWQKTLGKF